MGRYTVNSRYSAFTDGRRFGPFEPGAEVELEDVDAEWVNRDSPGTLTLVNVRAAVEPEPDPVVEPEPTPAKPPAANRQAKGGRNRAGG